MYLNEKGIKKIFSIIEKSFQEVTVMVETMSPFVVKHVKEKDVYKRQLYIYIVRGLGHQQQDS